MKARMLSRLRCWSLARSTMRPCRHERSARRREPMGATPHLSWDRSQPDAGAHVARGRRGDRDVVARGASARTVDVRGVARRTVVRSVIAAIGGENTRTANGAIPPWWGPGATCPLGRCDCPAGQGPTRDDWHIATPGPRWQNRGDRRETGWSERLKRSDSQGQTAKCWYVPGGKPRSDHVSGHGGAWVIVRAVEP